MTEFIKYLISQARIKVGRLRRDAKPLPDRFPKYRIGRGSYGPLEIEEFGDGATLQIGAFCSFAKGVTILLGGEHRTDWITTYPFDRKYFNDKALPRSTFAKGGGVIVGNDVWIGRDTLILSGSRIGDGAVIGARSVVRGEIPSYSICGGTPAKVIKYRFSEAIIEALRTTSWWDWPDERIAQELKVLSSAAVGEFVREQAKGASSL